MTCLPTLGESINLQFEEKAKGMNYVNQNDTLYRKNVDHKE